jgi:hypothetical protein
VISVVQAEIGNLIRVLKSMGDQALVSVQEGLKECESEKWDLTKTLSILSDEEKLLAGVTEDSERFLDAWRWAREIFSGASAAVQRELVHSFVEDLVWTPADPRGKTGTYRLKFFPRFWATRRSQDVRPKTATAAAIPPTQSRRTETKTHRC